MIWITKIIKSDVSIWKNNLLIRNNEKKSQTLLKNLKIWSSRQNRKKVPRRNLEINTK